MRRLERDFDIRLRLLGIDAWDRPEHLTEYSDILVYAEKNVDRRSTQILVLMTGKDDATALPPDQWMDVGAAHYLGNCVIVGHDSQLLHELGHLFGAIDYPPGDPRYDLETIYSYQYADRTEIDRRGQRRPDQPAQVPAILVTGRKGDEPGTSPDQVEEPRVSVQPETAVLSEGRAVPAARNTGKIMEIRVLFMARPPRKPSEIFSPVKCKEGRNKSHCRGAKESPSGYFFRNSVTVPANNSGDWNIRP